MTTDIWTDTQPIECVDDNPDYDNCRGTVEYRMALSATGVNFPRCDEHWGTRLVEQDRINSTYGSYESVSPPSWFDPLDAGERWDEEY